MINKIYEKIKNIIKNYYKEFIVYIILVALFTIELPYYIDQPGGLIDTSEKIQTSDNFKMKGSLNLTYVSEVHANIPILIWSHFQKDWDIEKEEEVVVGSESIDDLNYRNRLLLAESNKIAELIAYKHSSIDYEIDNIKVFVTYVDDLAQTSLKVKDQIIKIDGKDAHDKNFLTSYVKSKSPGYKFSLTVLRDDKEKEVKATSIDFDGDAKIGVFLTEIFDIKSNKMVKFNTDASESGPSGGMMMALTIYSNINEIDLTGGKKIAGTGTIEINGNVGEISGVKYKLIGAVKNKADIFIVPKGNYKEAKKIKDERGFDIDLVPVETFDQLLNYLKK